MAKSDTEANKYKGFFNISEFQSNKTKPATDGKHLLSFSCGFKKLNIMKQTFDLQKQFILRNDEKGKTFYFDAQTNETNSYSVQYFECDSNEINAMDYCCKSNKER